jgi:quercetin dioxygenase-like cupin family protein
MPEESHEKIVAELAKDIDRDNPSSLVFDLSKYQVYSPESATVVFAYISGQLGMVFWNLEPGQENDYHMHPTTEHLHVVVAGEVEYTLGDLEPIRVGPGQAVMVPEQVPHGIRNVGTTRASYFAVTSPGDYQKVLVERPS